MRKAHGWTEEDARRAQRLASQLPGMSRVPGVNPWHPATLRAWADARPLGDPQARMVGLLLGDQAQCSIRTQKA